MFCCWNISIETGEILLLHVGCASKNNDSILNANKTKLMYIILEPNRTLIYKTYLGRLVDGDYSIILNDVGSQFTKTYITYSQVSSSQTLEIYVVMRYREKHNLNLIPNKQMILEFPVFKTLKEEFERAIKFLS